MWSYHLIISFYYQRVFSINDADRFASPHRSLILYCVQMAIQNAMTNMNQHIIDIWKESKGRELQQTNLHYSHIMKQMIEYSWDKSIITSSCTCDILDFNSSKEKQLSPPHQHVANHIILLSQNLEKLLREEINNNQNEMCRYILQKIPGILYEHCHYMTVGMIQMMTLLHNPHLNNNKNLHAFLSGSDYGNKPRTVYTRV